MLKQADAHADRNGAPLNPYHTHFVFVDNGMEGSAAWASEIPMRSALESVAAEIKGTPIVQLVVQGGLGTLKTVLSTAMAGQPIVILSDSGGAATAIYEYIRLGGGIDCVDDAFSGG